MVGDTQKIWIFFTTGKFRFDWLFKKDCRHVFALTHDGFCWIRHEARNDIARSTVLPVEPSRDMVREYKSNGMRCVTIEIEVNEERKPTWNGWNPLNCVAFVKQICGLRVLKQTPWSLYKWLLKTKRDGQYRHRNIHHIKNIYVL